MAHTIQRLTLYALITALEGDLRDIVVLHISPAVTPETLFAPGTARKASERFGKDYPEGQPDLEDLLTYLDFGDIVSTIKLHDRHLDENTRTYIRRFYEGLDHVVPVRNRVMHSRPLEYEDLPELCNLATELEKSHRTLWANIRTTQRLLERNPDFVYSLSIPNRLDDSTRLLHNLPQGDFDDTGFMHRKRELDDLKKALFGSYPVVNVIGEGGLGKTALALKACYDILDSPESELDAIVWTTAKATKLTATEVQLIDNAITSSLVH